MLPQRALSIRDAAVSLKHKLSSELGQCYSSAATREAEREEAERRREEAERLAHEQQLERDRQRVSVLRGARLMAPKTSKSDSSSDPTLTPHTADSAQRAAQQMQKSNSARRKAAEVAQAEVTRAQATVQVRPN